MLAGLSESVLEQLQVVSMFDIVESLVQTGKLKNYPESASLPAGSASEENEEENEVIDMTYDSDNNNS